MFVYSRHSFPTCSEVATSLTAVELTSPLSRSDNRYHSHKKPHHTHRLLIILFTGTKKGPLHTFTSLNLLPTEKRRQTGSVYPLQHTDEPFLHTHTNTTFTPPCTHRTLPYIFTNTQRSLLRIHMYAFPTYTIYLSIETAPSIPTHTQTPKNKYHCLHTNWFLPHTHRHSPLFFLQIHRQSEPPTKVENLFSLHTDNSCLPPNTQLETFPHPHLIPRTYTIILHSLQYTHTVYFPLNNTSFGTFKTSEKQKKKKPSLRTTPPSEEHFLWSKTSSGAKPPLG